MESESIWNLHGWNRAIPKKRREYLVFVRNQLRTALFRLELVHGTAAACLLSTDHGYRSASVPLSAAEWESLFWGSHLCFSLFLFGLHDPVHYVRTIAAHALEVTLRLEPPLILEEVK